MKSPKAKTPSFKKFDYRIRTNKNTERKMLAEAFRKLSGFESVEKYRYIGFGSVTFSDFVLFHNSLNICDMISIEAKQEYKARFDFNRPYRCIDIIYGASNDVLPGIDWRQKSIVWLDYDGPLNDSVLQDVALLSTKLVSGSLLLITVNANGYLSPTHGRDVERDQEQLLQRFARQLERDVPTWVNGLELQGDEMAKVCQRMINDEIDVNLRNINGMASPDQAMKFESIFNFIYSDGATMLTVGGIFYKQSERNLLQNCHFDTLSFIQKDLYNIDIPIITPRERQFLNQQLPKKALSKLKDIGLTDEEIENYAELYRYSPSFAEIELS